MPTLSAPISFSPTVTSVPWGSLPYLPDIANGLVSLASQPKIFLSNTPTFDGPAGTFFITTTFTNPSNLLISKPFFEVIELSGVNILLHANAGP